MSIHTRVSFTRWLLRPKHMIAFFITIGLMSLLLCATDIFAGRGPSDKEKQSLSKVKGADITVYELYKENKAKNREKAAGYANIFLDKVDTAATHPVIADMASFLSEYYENDKEVYSKALRFGKTAARIYDANSMRKPLVRQQLNNARLYTRLERLDSALQQAHNASIHIKEEDLDDRIDYNKIMGMIFHLAGDQELSRTYFRESTRISTEEDNGMGASESIGNEAALSFKTEQDKQKSIQLLKEAVEKAEKSNDKNIIGTLYLNLAGAYTTTGDYKTALSYCKKAEVTARSLSQRGHLATVKAKIHIQNDSFPAAIDELKEALTIYGQGEFPGLTLNIYENIASLYENIGDTASAYRYLHAYKNLYDSIGKDDTIKRLYTLHNRYREEEIEKTAGRHSRNRLILILSIIIALIAVGALFAIHYIRRRIRRQVETRLDRRIKEENQVAEIRCFRCNKIRDQTMERLNQVIEKNRSSRMVPELKEVVGMLKESQNETTTSEISQYVSDFDSDMYRRLIKDFPNLTPNESRICVLVSKNMSTKQISDITRQSNEAIKMARTRLRNKLGLTGNKMTLQEFLNKYKFRP